MQKYFFVPTICGNEIHYLSIYATSLFILKPFSLKFFSYSVMIFSSAHSLACKSKVTSRRVKPAAGNSSSEKSKSARLSVLKAIAPLFVRSGLNFSRNFLYVRRRFAWRALGHGSQKFMYMRSNVPAGRAGQASLHRRRESAHL